MSESTEFILATGRALSQMALYSTDHPMVKDIIDQAHNTASSFLIKEPELILSLHEKKLLLNGSPVDAVPESAMRPFQLVLSTHGLHSISFLRGLTRNDMVSFLQLASRNMMETGKMPARLADYFSAQGVSCIRVNQAKYTKVGENEEVGAKGSLQGGQDRFLEEVDSLKLDGLLKGLIERSVSKSEDRLKILGLVSRHIQQEIEDAVQKATISLRKENTKSTNERIRTEGVMEAMADGVVVVDETGNVLMMNPAAEFLYGVKLGECLGKPLWQGVREQQMVALAKDLAIPTDRPLIKEVQLQAEQETKRILRASAATVQDPSGRVVGMVSVLSDVTKQKELTRLQNEFMANVTHDLRTPIHALKLAVSAILEGSAGPVSPEQEKMLSLANRNVERLSRLIDDLLDFSQIESGTLRINPQQVDVPLLLKEAAQGLEAWAKSRGVRVFVENFEKLPNAYSDADRTLQVMVNLISNAIKFTPSGGSVALRAVSHLDRGKPYVRVEIEDTGPGISKEDQDRIFQRFVQLNNKEKLDVRGTGLGLSICKALVDLQKGILGIKSPVPGKSAGSIFYFTLPVMEKAIPVQAKESPALSAMPSEKKGFWKKLMSRFSVLLLLALSLVSKAPAKPFHGEVRRVLAPDTLQFQDGAQVKMLGIDAPKKGDPFYSEAVSLTREWVEGKDVYLIYGIEERTLEGQWLAYVFIDGVFVNGELVREGLATVARLSNEEDYLKKLVRAEREARRKKRGLWKSVIGEEKKS